MRDKGVGGARDEAPRATADKGVGDPAGAADGGGRARGARVQEGARARGDVAAGVVVEEVVGDYEGALMWVGVWVWVGVVVMVVETTKAPWGVFGGGLGVGGWVLWWW